MSGVAPTLDGQERAAIRGRISVIQTRLTCRGYADCGLIQRLPPIEPRKWALPKQNTPPSEATKR